MFSSTLCENVGQLFLLHHPLTTERRQPWAAVRRRRHGEAAVEPARGRWHGFMERGRWGRESEAMVYWWDPKAVDGCTNLKQWKLS
jgi:hypothetical protein